MGKKIDDMSSEKNVKFRETLFEWFSSNHRPLPWKGERDPYLIWLSEIILQQTTVAQGTSYFENFKKQYPSVLELAEASSDEVMKLWEGLGYYSRARNLHTAAQYIAFELKGFFPNTYEGILGLKGVGPYTAAAIASFAYDLPYVVIDGNVYRVLARVFGIETPIDTTQGRHLFANLANELLDKQRPADFNQAIMDFGATHCTPTKPKCSDCLFKAECRAFLENKVQIVPIKSKKMVRRERFFNYFILHQGDYVFIKKREEKDIWQGLYDFPLVETEGYVEKEDWANREMAIHIADFRLLKQSQVYHQLLTHQKINTTFWEIDILDEADILRGGSFQKVRRKQLNTFAFPKVIDSYLKEKVLTLF